MESAQEGEMVEIFKMHLCFIKGNHGILLSLLQEDVDDRIMGERKVLFVGKK